MALAVHRLRVLATQSDSTTRSKLGTNRLMIVFPVLPLSVRFVLALQLLIVMFAMAQIATQIAPAR
jgi:hypothetical protein